MSSLFWLCCVAVGAFSLCCGDVGTLLLREVLQESIYIRYGAARFGDGESPFGVQCSTKGEDVRCVADAW